MTHLKITDFFEEPQPGLVEVELPDKKKTILFSSLNEEILGKSDIGSYIDFPVIIEGDIISPIRGNFIHRFLKKRRLKKSPDSYPVVFAYGKAIVNPSVVIEGKIVGKGVSNNELTFNIKAKGYEIKYWASSKESKLFEVGDNVKIKIYHLHLDTGFENMLEYNLDDNPTKMRKMTRKTLDRICKEAKQNK